MNVLYFGSDRLLSGLTGEASGQNWEVARAFSSEQVLDFEGTHLFQGAVVELGCPSAETAQVALQAKHHLRVPIVIGIGPEESLDRCIQTRKSDIDIFFAKSGIARINKRQCDGALRLANGVETEAVVCGQVTYHTTRDVFSIAGRDIHLPYMKHKLLQLLFVKQGCTVTKAMMLNYLYGWNEPPREKTLDVFVCQLRKQLRELGAQDEVIRTVWGQGYTVPRAVARDLTKVA